MQNQPQAALPWQTLDKQGTLSSCSGMYQFCTWLALRHKASGSLSYLKWATWYVDWIYNFDFATQSGTSRGMGGKLLGIGDGQGLITPLTDDPVANEVSVIHTY